MQFKLIISLTSEEISNKIVNAAREAGAMGATVIGHARGEGVNPAKTFFGLSLEMQRDVLLFLVEEHLSRYILEKIAEVGGFSDIGEGIAFQLDVEDAVGVSHQMKKLTPMVEQEI